MKLKPVQKNLLISLAASLGGGIFTYVAVGAGMMPMKFTAAYVDPSSASGTAVSSAICLFFVSLMVLNKK